LFKLQFAVLFFLQQPSYPGRLVTNKQLHAYVTSFYRSVGSDIVLHNRVWPVAYAG